MGYKPVSAQRQTRGRGCRPVLVATAFVSLLLFYLHRSRVSSYPDLSVTDDAVGPFCPDSALQDDVLVVLRTGATEALEKLPVHFDTTLRCVPHYVIYSDMEEDMGSHHLYDILDQVNETVKNTAPEFDLYKRLRAQGRRGLYYQTVFGTGPAGAVENPGWKLDKWKFLPMVERALQHRHGAKWFVFIESDTYLIWPTLLAYLGQFDAGKPHYIGKPMLIGDDLFAHGGSGFVLSRPAAERVARHWRAHEAAYDAYTMDEWAGDLVLGQVLRDAGIELLWALPHFQGTSLDALDWATAELDKLAWCYAPATFHHMNKPTAKMLWAFEQRWHRQQHAQRTHEPMRYRDIFRGLVRGQLRADAWGWDNLASGIAEYRADTPMGPDATAVERQAPKSRDKCHAACLARPSCLMFSFVPGSCMVSDELRLGHTATEQCREYSGPAGKCVRWSRDVDAVATGWDKGKAKGKDSVRSGWMLDRVQKFLGQLDARCTSPEGNDWVLNRYRIL
ncbi:glycosyltransferase family 31 protein [Xylariomycetidae sp. FL0641]|nr:glycosyltransferase family 31 protein [Xylariomycetidae sp. FL0641]